MFWSQEADKAVLFWEINYHNIVASDLCQLGTLLYVIRDVTSNMMIAHWP
jgi:hypothetical protein